MQAKVFVTLKESVLDPQGTAVRKALETLDYQNVHDVRIGKMILLQLDEADKTKAEAQVKEMCEKILTNPVIENYSYELEG